MVSGTIDHKCPSCLAPLKFDPKSQKWKCEYCGNVFSLDELNDKNAKVEVDTETKIDKVHKNTEGLDVYTCPDCGAEIIADEQTSATFCVYCKNTAILKNKLVGEFNPSKLIPFKKTREDAVAALLSLKKGRPFIPKDFLNKKNIEEMKGIYIPFWLYDYHVNGDITADAKRVSSWTSGNYRYTKTDTYLVTRAGNMTFNKVPVDGSTRFDNDMMNSIEPFDYKELIDFDYSYLSGFFAEKYDVNSEDASKDAKKRSEASTIDCLRKDIVGYDSVIVSNSNINIDQLNDDYVLLPVWMLNIKYKDKMYKFAMNAQTGKMIGDIPLDSKKAVIWWIIGFIIMFSLCLLFLVITK